MSQKDQVIEALARNGGYATFSELNRIVDCSGWGTKTPFASIRRIVQTNPGDFYRIRPGQWGLVSKKDEIERYRLKDGDNNDTHGYYQGVIVELGNLKEDLGEISNKQKPVDTYVPPQDKNRRYSHARLGDIVTMSDIVPFTGEKILRRAKTVDVIWFNMRNMPIAFFEIEHSTDMQNSLDKYIELQDFHAKFYIVSDEANHRRFDDFMKYSRYDEIKSRVKFMAYDRLARYHTYKIESAIRSAELLGE